ncbi:MAG: aldehyde dehydrogenase family protein, partial [Chitinophagaceae bacterium]|nr:aldehyde dehydrogenase family protein [Chitinophagaceae bacterium]
MKYNPVQNFINGQFVNAKSKNTLAVISPVDGHSLSTVPLSNADDLNDAVQAAQKAFPAWSSLPIKERVQVFFRFKTLLERDLQELAALCTEENGKTMAESIAEIEKCIELTEFATSLPQLISGEILEVSKGVECRTEHAPLGVVA